MFSEVTNWARNGVMVLFGLLFETTVVLSGTLLAIRKKADLGYFCIGFTFQTSERSPHVMQSLVTTVYLPKRNDKETCNLLSAGATAVKGDYYSLKVRKRNSDIRRMWWKTWLSSHSSHHSFTVPVMSHDDRRRCTHHGPRIGWLYTLHSSRHNLMHIVKPIVYCIWQSVLWTAEYAVSSQKIRLSF